MNKEIMLQRHVRFDGPVCSVTCDFFMCNSETNDFPRCTLEQGELQFINEDEDEDYELFPCRTQFCIDNIGN